MLGQLVRLTAVTLSLVAAASTAHADVCLAIDDARDTLPASDRAAALRLLTRQFESEGERVVPAGCTSTYTVFHTQLGDIVLVSLSGPKGQREGTAFGTADLPAVYSQMVRSLLTGRAMSDTKVVDRTNVTASQASAKRVHSDSLWYARLGYGSLFGDKAYATPALGFGYRAELNSFGVDVSFLNVQFPAKSDYSYGSSNAAAGSFLKLSGLYFLNPKADRTTYLGAGMSYGHRGFGQWGNVAGGYYSSQWEGSGLQGELTAGYEFARVTSLRLFVQADAILPFYEVTSQTISRAGRVTSTDRRYAPSLVLSLGIGR